MTLNLITDGHFDEETGLFTLDPNSYPQYPDIVDRYVLNLRKLDDTHFLTDNHVIGK